jgi:hypothetical protein
MGYKAKTTKKVGLRGLTLGDRSQHSWTHHQEEEEVVSDFNYEYTQNWKWD